jgi:hypothetical protein
VILTTAHCLFDKDFLFTGEVTLNRTNPYTKVRVHQNVACMDTIAWYMTNLGDSRVESRYYCALGNHRSNLPGSFHERSISGQRAHILNGSYREMFTDSETLALVKFQQEFQFSATA